MNAKKSLESRIRGWFPSTPNLPQHQNKLPKIAHVKALVNPLSPMLEAKFQRSAGILIGFGICLMALGFVAALFANFTYNEFARTLSYQGIGTDSYMFRDLLQNIAFFLALGIGGVFVAVLGALSLRTEIFREATVNKEKRFLSNFSFGLGAGLIILSFRYVFLFVLAPNDPILNHGYLQLQFFAGFFIVGTVLFTAGVLSWRKKK